MRGKADQWVAASLFSLASFAAFSIAAVVGQLVHILRQSVMESFLPSMSRLQAAGDVRGMLEMNSRGNVMVGKLLYPVLAFVFVFAPELVTMVYTASYSEAAPVMRVYILGMAASVVEMGSLVHAAAAGDLRAGRDRGHPRRLDRRELDRGAILRPARRGRRQRARDLPRSPADPAAAGESDRHRAAARCRTGARLATRLGVAALSGAAAWSIAEWLLAAHAPLVRVAVGAAVIALVHAPAHLPRLVQFATKRNAA